MGRGTICWEFGMGWETVCWSLGGGKGVGDGVGWAGGMEETALLIAPSVCEKRRKADDAPPALGSLSPSAGDKALRETALT